MHRWREREICRDEGSEQYKNQRKSKKIRRVFGVGRHAYFILKTGGQTRKGF